MRIGVPKEIKDHEDRVALTPAGVHVLAERGHPVRIETQAGTGSGFTDDDYRQAGGHIVPSANEAWDADLILKVKEPLPQEYGYFKPGRILFTYLHLAAVPELAKALLEQQMTAVAYETVQLSGGGLPLLTPMSEVAGRMSVQIGARFLETFHGGRGILPGGVPGVPPADVIILGGGIVGTNAAKMAKGLGANVVIIEKSADRMRYLDDVFHGEVTTLMSNSFNIAQALRKADLLIGAVLVPGARAPKLATEPMIRDMKQGAVIVDVAVDQGGSIETIDRVTTHSDPVYVKHGVVHYAVANIPGAVPRTSTLALTNVTLEYVCLLADRGLQGAIGHNGPLAKGVNTAQGKLTHPAVAEALSMPYTPLNEVYPGLA